MMFEASDSAITVLAIVGDAETRALLPRAIRDDELLVASEAGEALSLAKRRSPDVAFIDVSMGEGAGLAMVHHLKAIAPEITIFALTTPESLESCAQVVALGGAGLLMLPLDGDDVLSALAGVKQRRAERAVLLRLERVTAMNARAAGWIARLAELCDAPDKASAARQLADVLIEATEAAGAAIYLVDDMPGELVRVASTPGLSDTPPSGAEAEVMDVARSKQLLAVPLTTRKLRVGWALLREAARADAGPRIDGLVRVLATQATTALALFAERERTTAGTTIKDPTSSAYSFAYYVDVAGREIDKARRHGRRFAIATVVLEPPPAEPIRPWAGDAPLQPSMSPAEVADHLLKAMRDTDVLARIDENEFHLLLPETDGLAAHACRRRVLARLSATSEARGRRIPEGLLVGVAAFPHDGHDLSQLLRTARRRAEATRASVVHEVGLEPPSVPDMLDALLRRGAPGDETSAPRPIELAMPDAAALATSVVADALRGGATFLAVTNHPRLRLGAAVRAATAQARDNVVVHALDLGSLPRCEDLEALAVLAEHGTYALVGRSRGGVLTGVHAADPLLADVLAERLGRAAGLRVFG